MNNLGFYSTYSDDHKDYIYIDAFEDLRKNLKDKKQKSNNIISETIKIIQHPFKLENDPLIDIQVKKMSKEEKEKAKKKWIKKTRRSKKVKVI